MRSLWRTAPLIAAALVSFCASAPVAEAQTPLTNLNPNGLNRTVQIRTRHARPMRGMTCTGPVKIVGSVTTDSYDSGDPNKSNPNMVGWYDPAKRGEMAFIGTTSKTPGDFKVTGTAKVVGTIGTGAPGVYDSGGGASVGTKSWIDSGATGLQSPSYLQDDLNMSFPNVVLPFVPGPNFMPLPSTNAGTVYLYSMGTATYIMDSFSISGTAVKAIVTGRAILYVRGGFSISSGATLTILTNASLDVYVGGSSTSISGGILNQNNKPESFTYYGLPTNTSIIQESTAAWVGSIYAPQAAITFGGSSDFYGASISKEITLTGGFGYHYDEALNRKGVQYLPVSWKEL
jgi:hypothetical protein